jgi:hypothetical protein
MKSGKKTAMESEATEQGQTSDWVSEHRKIYDELYKQIFEVPDGFQEPPRCAFELDDYVYAIAKFRTTGDTKSRFFNR